MGSSCDLRQTPQNHPVSNQPLQTSKAKIQAAFPLVHGSRTCAISQRFCFRSSHTTTAPKQLGECVEKVTRARRDKDREEISFAAKRDLRSFPEICLSNKTAQPLMLEQTKTKSTLLQKSPADLYILEKLCFQ